MVAELFVGDADVKIMYLIWQSSCMNARMIQAIFKSYHWLWHVSLDFFNIFNRSILYNILRSETD
ncbi:hypothetical protein MARINOS108_120174 [Marinoscillum sp. 108]|nr:hypothetical protein MARINOS108_120174 [Marinoscillum sp. 108]